MGKSIAKDAPPERIQARRVLVVDDNRDAADAVSALLRFMGYEVTTAYHGAEGLQSASASSPDVAIWDLSMPDIDGFEAARRLREHRHGRSVFLIALSGQSSAEATQAAREAGFDLHLGKPMNVAALLEAIGCA